MLGGVARDPELRPLLESAGLMLSEDVANDTVLVNRAAAILGEAGAGAGAQTYDDARAVAFAAKLFAPDESPRKRQGGRPSRNPQPTPASGASASSRASGSRAAAAASATIATVGTAPCRSSRLPRASGLPARS